MGKYRHGRKRMLASGAKLAGVPLWEIWFFVRNAFWWLGSALFRLWQLNPFSVIARRQRQLYQFHNKGGNFIQPPWTERIGDFFRSDEGRKRRLLQWVQRMVPRLGVEDFTTCWHDGLALCSLLEELCPGLCPRPHLLNPHHRVNNCRLGIKLAQRYLGVSTTLIRAEEMAIADTDMEVNIIHLIQLIKWKHQRGGATTLQASVSPKTRLSTTMQQVPVQVVARGTGLKAGIVGRRAKFNILTDSAAFLDLHIEIQGPNNEVNSERITSLNQGLDRRQAARGRSPPGYAATSEDEGKSKLIEDDVGNVFLRQKSVEEELQQNVIPFDYQCVGEGRFLVTYIPRSAGTYFISIKSYEVDIEGSPFEVKVSDWMTSWNVMPKPRVMSFDMLPSIEETPAREKTSPHPEKSKDVKRPSSTQHRMAQVSRQLTIMKKRVLKRVITRNGEEILLTPSPTLSRQSSADVSDLSEDEGKRREKPEKSPGRKRSPACKSAAEMNSSEDSPKNNPTSKPPPGEKKGCDVNDQEDFSNNSCNITLSVTSFEDEEEEKLARTKETSSPAVKPAQDPPKSPAFTDSSSTAVTYDMTPGMYPSSPKRLAKIPESPIHINVRSQLLGPSSPHEADLYTVTNEKSDKDEAAGKEQETNGYNQHLNVSPRCLSPSTSDDASGSCSDFVEFDMSPAPKKTFKPEFSGTGSASSPSHQTPNTQLKSSANRRRFEETLSQRDKDADDSGDAYSQLVSALTEFDPTPPKKVVRSYSDGAKVGGPARNGHFNIRLKRMERNGGEGWWGRASSEREGVNGRSPPVHWSAPRTQSLQSHNPHRSSAYTSDGHHLESHILQPRDFTGEGSSQRLSPFTSSSSGSLSSGPEEKHSGGEQEKSDGRPEPRRTHMWEARKKWKTFDGSTIVEEEGELGRRSTWRFSLQGKRSHSFTAPGWQHQQMGADGRMLAFTYHNSADLENMSIMDKLNDDDEILEVVIEAEEPHYLSSETCNDTDRGNTPVEDSEETHQEVNDDQQRLETASDLESSVVASPAKQAFRGNLSRQDNVTGSNKSSSEASTETDKSQTTAATQGKLPGRNDSEGRRFRTIQKQKRRAKGTKAVSILVPKAKTDKSTQVSYYEIKAETGWKPPAVRLHRRKKYLKVTATTTTTSNTTTNINTNTTYNNSNDLCCREGVLSRESSVSANTDLLTASPVKLSRLSSKSSSFSDTSLVFACDVPELPENSAPGREGTELESVSGDCPQDARGEDGKVNSDKDKICVDGDGKRDSKEPSSHPTPTEGVRKEIPQQALHQQNNKTTDYSSESTDSSRHHGQFRAPYRDSRVLPPPYSRARSDPQFSRRSYFPEDLRDDLDRRGGAYRGRPPRPRDSHVLDWIQRAAERGEHEQPERQSTVDTLDSGIENESPIYSRFISGHRRIHRRPYPWSIDLEPSLVRANAANLELGHDPFSGHRRLARRPYQWEMDLDPRLVQGNGSSRSAGDEQDHDSLQLTLGVIEAAVHHTVRRLLSASSVASSGSHRNLPTLPFRESDRESRRGEGGGEGGSYSDSELYAFSREELVLKRKRGRKKPRSALNKAATSTMKDDFFRSMAVLCDGSSSRGLSRQASPDIGETKSDGRYSPYSVTDIPCFELPSQSSHRPLLGSPTNIRTFPTPPAPPANTPHNTPPATDFCSIRSARTVTSRGDHQKPAPSHVLPLPPPLPRRP